MKCLIEYQLPENINTIYDFPIYMELDINNNPIKFRANLLCWSNEKQQNVPLVESIIFDYLSKEGLNKCIDYYENIKNEYLMHLYKTITTITEFEKFICHIKSPQFVYPKGLIKKFGKKTLDYIMINIFKSAASLDIQTFEFIPNEVPGWYSNGIEVCSSSNFNFKTGEEMTSQKVLNILFKDSETEIDKLLNLCAQKWIEYCGVSLSKRTLYWDIALSLCKKKEVFEDYILSYSEGKESLAYDVCICNDQCYEDIKRGELSLLEENKKILLLFGYNILISSLKTIKQT